MRRTLFLPLCLITFGLLCPDAHAGEGWYIQGAGGASLAGDATFSGAGGDDLVEYEPGLNLSGSAGYGFSRFRIEAELAYRANEVEEIDGLRSEGDVETYCLLLNCFFEFENRSRWVPYIGFGAGLADFRLSDLQIGAVNLDERDSVPAYQVAVGVGLDVDDQLSFTLDYRYFTTSDPNFDGIDAEYDAHTLTVGLKIFL
ncbi:MAG: porin family protein [bacterium]|nr:MAG: porin family protein [bacterium]